MDKKTYTEKEVRHLVRDYARYVRDAYRVPIRHVFLFGSYAKKNAHPWSDIDVCIVSPLFDHEDRLSFLWKRRRAEDVDAMIAPVGFAPRDFQGHASSPLVHEIQTTGEEIALDA